jgi:hypothetical protein
LKLYRFCGFHTYPEFANGARASYPVNHVWNMYWMFLESIGQKIYLKTTKSNWLQTLFQGVVLCQGPGNYCMLWWLSGYIGCVVWLCKVWLWVRICSISFFFFFICDGGGTSTGLILYVKNMSTHWILPLRVCDWFW